MKTTIYIKGTHCASCKALIEEVCKEMKRLISCKVDFKTGKTELEYEKDFDFQKLKNEIEGLGRYTVYLDKSL
jgi:copper chaperone CopZ